MRRSRNAKIIATLGPSSSSPTMIRALFEAARFADVQTVQDLEQRDRITLGRRPA